MGNKCISMNLFIYFSANTLLDIFFIFSFFIFHIRKIFFFHKLKRRIITTPKDNSAAARSSDNLSPAYPSTKKRKNPPSP